MDRKIFQIGFNRCATRAIEQFFAGHGYQTAHWEFGNLAKDLEADLAAGRRPLLNWQDTDVFTDMEFLTESTHIEGFRHFRKLYWAYPDALFILNTRNIENWLRSRIKHADGFFLTAYQNQKGYSSKGRVIDDWRKNWLRHHLDVMDFFTKNRRKQLFIWNIRNPNFKHLSNLLGRRFDPDHWHKIGGVECANALLR